MKVYLLFMNDAYLAGGYSTLQKAKKAISERAKVNGYSRKRYVEEYCINIEEWELDSGTTEGKIVFDESYYYKNKEKSK